jgi:hypothetical protein
MTTPHEPPMASTNEADEDQLAIARAQGDAYGRAMQAVDEESGAAVRRAGDYLVAFVQEDAEGMYGFEEGELTWHEPPGEANAHVEIAVADGADGRFVPGLDIALSVLDDDGEVLRTVLPFLWHPFLHHYGANVRLPAGGPFTVRAEIEPPRYMQHDPVNGKRYAERVEVVFDRQRFTPGRKPSPEAEPRGGATVAATSRPHGATAVGPASRRA